MRALFLALEVSVSVCLISFFVSLSVMLPLDSWYLSQTLADTVRLDHFTVNSILLEKKIVDLKLDG